MTTGKKENRRKWLFYFKQVKRTSTCASRHVVHFTPDQLDSLIEALKA